MNIQIFPIDQDRYKLTDEFKTGSHCSIFLGATCPKLLKKSLSGHAGSQVSNHSCTYQILSPCR